MVLAQEDGAMVEHTLGKENAGGIEHTQGMVKQMREAWCTSKARGIRVA